MSDIRFNQWLHQSGTGGVSQVASGAVGVGTTNPLADFYVRGDAQITGILTAGHIAMGSSITFGDDDRAYFGDGTDLQIYHSGSHSFIQDTGTGNLFIDSNSVQIRNAVASKTTAKFMEDAQVELYYNNTERIRTTNTGAVVTGILTATSFVGSGANLTSLPAQATISNNADDRVITGGSGVNLNGEQRLTFNSSNILTATETGTGNGMGGIRAATANAGGNAGYGFMTNSANRFAVTTIGSAGAESLRVYDDNNNAERLRITSDGKLLVGATAATNGSIAEFSKSVAGGAAGCHITVENTSTNSVNNTAGIHLKTDTGTAKFFKYRAAQTFLQSAAGGASELLLQASGAHPMRLYAGDAERVRIHDTGEVHFYGNQTSAPEGDFGFRWDRNQPVDFCLKNTNNTSVNAGARIKLIANIGNIAMHYVNNGGFYLNNSASGYLHYYTGGTSRLYIDTSGNININNAGTIGTSNGNVGKRLAIKSTLNNIIIGETTNSGNSGLILESRVTGRSGNARCSQIDLGNGTLKFYTAAAGADVTEKLRIDSSGRVLIGMTSGSGAQLQVDDGIQVYSTAVNGNLNCGTMDFTGNNFRLMAHNSSAGCTLSFLLNESSGVGVSEKGRFNPNGHFLVGTTSDTTGGTAATEGVAIRKEGHVVSRGTSGSGAKFTAKTTDTGGSQAFRVMLAQTEIGSITMGAGGTAFNTSSDYRRKENVIDLTGAITRLKTLLPKRFNFKDEPSVTRDGFLAHEVTAVPEAVTGTKDEVATEDGKEYKKGDPIYQQLDPSKLVPLLVAALQEEISKREALEARVAAIEGS